MNLPFGLQTSRENAKKKESLEAALYYERRMAEYRDTLERYKKCLFDNINRLDSYDKRSMDNQLSIVQTALDLTYLKEQGDQMIELLEEQRKVIPEDKGLETINNISETLHNVSSNLESLATSLLDANYKLDGLDKNVVNRLSELMMELQKQSLYQNRQLQADMTSDFERLTKSVKRGHVLLWFLFILSLFSLSGIVFIGLYIMEIIPF